MIKLIHAADFHLDSPLDGLPAGKAVTRREELRAAVSSLVDMANENDVDLILLSGDLFDSSNFYFETAKRLSCELARANARVFISPGNHDYISPTCPYNAISWPENVHIFKKSEIESVFVQSLNLIVHGAAFTDKYCDTPLLTGFRAAEPERLNIMVMHGDAAQKSRYNAVSQIDIASSGLSYLALGHNHTFSGIKREGDTLYACPGCPEGRGFDETGNKGVIIGALDKTGGDFAFIPVNKRRYEEKTVYLTADMNPSDAVLKEVPPNEKLILRVALGGECGASGINIGLLQKELSGHYWHVVLRDHTKIRRDIWDERGEDTLKGLFLAAMHEKFTAAADLEKKIIERAVIYGLAALSGEEAPFKWL